MTEIYKKWDNLRRGVLQIKEADSVSIEEMSTGGSSVVQMIVYVDGQSVTAHPELLPCKIKAEVSLLTYISASGIFKVMTEGDTIYQLKIQCRTLNPGDTFVLYKDNNTYWLVQLGLLFSFQADWGITDNNSPSYIRNKPSVEVIGNRTTSINANTTATMYPTVDAVRTYVASKLSNKENVSNKVTSWSTEIPEEGANPVITPSNTKYPSEKLVYDTFQPKGNYLTAQDITGKADKSELPTVMGASGNNHKGGLVPDTPNTAGASKYLCEDGTWSIPAFEQTTVTEANITQTLNPNIYYSFGTVTQLTITFANVITGINNEYIFEFDSGNTATTLSIPATVIGINTATIKANKHYEISIKYDASNNNYYGLIQEW